MDCENERCQNSGRTDTGFNRVAKPPEKTEKEGVKPDPAI
ncbi:hypothetical protein EM595_p0021 (plasmid) [Duffyella gerundensis]|uniref:Uncharacterized protein n=1 Tax=Duffyella gerundensis TaxID=1619313 RepID=A0A0U5L4K7_9GAMM|nr:hypothetical protein EM595_p0021 [Duffyella gerundensis]